MHLFDEQASLSTHLYVFYRRNKACGTEDVGPGVFVLGDQLVVQIQPREVIKGCCSFYQKHGYNRRRVDTCAEGKGMECDALVFQEFKDSAIVFYIAPSTFKESTEIAYFELFHILFHIIIEGRPDGGWVFVVCPI